MIQHSCSARTIPLTFYCTGEDSQHSLKLNYQKQPNAFKDKSADVLTRNYYSVNTKAYEQLRNNHKSMKELIELNKERNNYLDPTYNYVTQQQVPKDINYRHYQFQKAKVYSKEMPILYQVQRGEVLSKEDYFKEKEKNIKESGSCIALRCLTKSNPLIEECPDLKPQKLKDNILKHNSIYEKKANKTQGKFSFENHKASNDAPQWMKRKPKRHDSKDDDNETIAVFSRFNQWITVSPKSRSRNKAFEKTKHNKENQTLIRPKWMHSTYWNYNSKKDNSFISLPYSDIHAKKPIAKAILIDKENINKLNTKSVLCYGDSRHNVPFGFEVEEYEKGISKLPKQFFY